MEFLTNYMGAYPALALVVFISAFIGMGLARLIVKIVSLFRPSDSTREQNIISENLNTPLIFGLPIIFGLIPIYVYDIGLFEAYAVQSFIKLFSVFMATWLIMRLVKIAALLTKRRFDMTTSDNLRARSMHTQINVLQRVFSFIIGLLGVASLFLLFEELKSLGVSLIASAGVAGIVIGFAAQKALGNLFAGLQIALTQPIKIDDAVVVESEWGWIEEITLTYVVVRIWDWRRLVLPISYFVEQPFQNWTKNSAEILGSVYLYVDYTIPVSKLREAFDNLLESNDKWDGKAKVLQVTDTKNNVMEIRMLMSAKNSPTCWDLRCEMREAMVDFVQKNYPQALPKMRAELEREDSKEN